MATATANLIIGRVACSSRPSDSLRPCFAANAHLAPGYYRTASRYRPIHADQRRRRTVSRQRLGVAKCTRPDRVGSSFWQSARLLAAAPSVARRVREQDQPWCAKKTGSGPVAAVWLTIFSQSASKASLDIVQDHWAEFGRTYYSRHDYEAIDTDQANQLIGALEGKLDSLAGHRAGSLQVVKADSFTYHDPVDGFRSAATRASGSSLRAGPASSSACRARHNPAATLRVYMGAPRTRPGSP